MPQMHQPALLQISNLQVSFIHPEHTVQALRGVSLTVRRGEIVALTGESGCGKSVLLKSILRLNSRHAAVTGGQIIYQPRPGSALKLSQLPERDLLPVRRQEIGAVFQDSMSSLNPAVQVGRQIVQRARQALKLTTRQAYARMLQLLAALDISAPQVRARQYPQFLSGGQRQRCALALGLAAKPKLLLADEITTALDPPVQAQILRLLLKLRSEQGLSILMVTHDLSAAAAVADRIAVMYAGRIVEIGTAEEVLRRPLHPYTQALLSALPTGAVRGQPLFTLPGEPPLLIDPPAYDLFALRNASPLKADFIAQPPFFALSATHAAASWTLHPKLSGRSYPCSYDLNEALNSAADAAEPEASAPPENLLQSAAPAACAPAAAPEPQAPAADAPVLLQAQDLSLSFELPGGRSVSVLDQINLQLHKGEILAVAGESGCGKSTLARCLCGLLRPDQGRVLLGGLELSDPKVYRRERLHICQQVQLLFQGCGAVNPELSCLEVLAEPLQALMGIRGREAQRQRAAELLELCLLPCSLLDTMAGLLSGGQLARLSLARALAVKPQILIADEPAAALDAPLQAQIMALLLNMTRRQGLSLILIFHNLQLLRCAADRAVILQAGRTVEEGAVPQIFDHPQHPCTQALINAALSTDPERARQQLLRSACSADP